MIRSSPFKKMGQALDKILKACIEAHMQVAWVCRRTWISNHSRKLKTKSSMNSHLFFTILTMWTLLEKVRARNWDSESKRGMNRMRVVVGGWWLRVLKVWRKFRKGVLGLGRWVWGLKLSRLEHHREGARTINSLRKGRIIRRECWVDSQLEFKLKWSHGPNQLLYPQCHQPESETTTIKLSQP